MTDLDLDAIEARADAATDGPWVVKHEPAWEADNVQHPDVITVGAQMWEGDDEPMTVCLVSTDYEDDPVDVLLDAEFIAHARTDVPALVAALREARAKVEAMRSWIDGAKVDLDGYDDARAAIDRVRALHVDEWVVIDYVGGYVCRECREPVESEPCATIRALDGGATDPQTQEGP